MTALLICLLTAAPTDALYQDLDPLYRQLHEDKTSALLQDRIKKLGFEVSAPISGKGFYAVQKRGSGPTVMIRTEMDALPVEEKTGLPYASQVKAEDGGKVVSLMHACGHDLHMTAWIGAAQALSADPGWSGTLVFVAQPAEEMGEGAARMIKDGVLSRMPKPDFGLALHNHGNLPAGKVGFVKGYALAAVDTVDVTVFGKGGHGAYPQTTVDPIAIAAKLVLSWQTLISRENNPLDPAVLTVGSFHAGTRANIISDEAKLSLTVRSYRPEVRQRLRDGIIRIANAEAVAAQAPKPPEVKIEAGPSAVYNDPDLTERMRKALVASLGADQVVETERVMGAEDFGEFGRAGGFPSAMLWLGSVEPKQWQKLHDAGQAPPSLHSATFAPDEERALKTALQSWVAMVHELMPAPSGK